MRRKQNRPFEGGGRTDAEQRSSDSKPSIPKQHKRFIFDGQKRDVRQLGASAGYYPNMRRTFPPVPAEVWEEIGVTAPLAARRRPAS